MPANENSGLEVTQDAGRGGLPRVRIKNLLATGEIYLHGATVTGYQPAGQRPVLFVSEQSAFAHGKAIRGGVPICWPWFGPHPTDPKLPQHGVARTAEWEVQGNELLDDGGSRLTLTLDTPEAHLQYDVTIGRSLITRLTTFNHTAKPLTFTQALHTYLVVGDVRQITVEGLAGKEYFDRLTQGHAKQAEPVIRFTGEYDRTYLNTTGPVTVTDPVLKRKITVTKQGSRSTVVWNPWIAKAKSLADMGDDEWQGFVCVETANAPGNEVTIAAGASSSIESMVTVA